MGEKPVSAKATYSEIEHFYRNRVPRFIPVVNGVLERFGLEVAQVQLNDSCWRTVEFYLNPSDIDPERDVLEKGVRSDFLRKVILRKNVHEYEGVLKELADNLGIDGDSSYDFSQLDGHTMVPIVFIRPKGSSIRFSDLVPVEDLYCSEFYPIRGVKEESPNDWGEDVWEQFDMVICSHENEKGELAQDPEGLPDRDSPRFGFYKVLSKSISWTLNVPLLEAFFEFGVNKSMYEKDVSPGVGEVLSRKEFYIEPLVVLVPPERGDSEDFPGKEDVEQLILSLRVALNTASSMIVNNKVSSVFQAGMEGIISEATEVFFLLPHKGSLYSYTSTKLNASSPEEVERAVSMVFERFGEDYEIASRNLTGKMRGAYSRSPAYRIQVEPFQDFLKKNPPNPISLPKDGSITTLLSPLNGISVEESSSTYRKRHNNPRSSSGDRPYYTETESTTVNLVAVGPSSTTTEPEEGGEVDFDVTFSPNNLVISDSPLPALLDYLNPSLDPKFTLHTYLFPLMPALLYYGLAAALFSKDAANERKVDLSVSSSFSPKNRPYGEVEEGFIKTFSTRVLELSSRFLKNVWEGTLEDRHKKYLEASENFLKVVSPREDRISTEVHYRTYRYADGSVRGATHLNLVVKYRQDEAFVSSVRDLLIQAVLLLAEMGEVEAIITFVY